MEVVLHGRIFADTAARLMAAGYDVPAIEERLISYGLVPVEAA